MIAYMVLTVVVAISTMAILWFRLWNKRIPPVALILYTLMTCTWIICTTALITAGE